MNIEQLRNQEPSSVKMLTRMVSEWTYHLVLSYVKNEQDAEEILQDIILAVLKGVHDFKETSSLKTWVYKIALNKAKDKLKYNSRAKRSAHLVSIQHMQELDRNDLEPKHFLHPGILLESREKLNIIFKGINQLPEKQKEVITLIKLENLKMDEASQIMGNSYKATESLLARARKNLKVFLETEGFDFYKNKKNGKK